MMIASSRYWPWTALLGGEEHRQKKRLIMDNPISTRPGGGGKRTDADNFLAHFHPSQMEQIPEGVVKG